MNNVFKKNEELLRSVVKNPVVICQYCNKPAKLTTGDKLYPHRPDLSNKDFWECVKCDAYVGCHEGTLNPYGTLANFETRKIRSVAHAAFDPLWTKGASKIFKSRRKAYAWLAHELKLKVGACHIGSFDSNRCKDVINVCKRKYVSK